MKLTEYENEIKNKLKHWYNKLSFDETISLINDIDVSLINSNTQEYVNRVKERALDLKNLETISLNMKNSDEIDYETLFKGIIFIESIISKYSRIFETRKHFMNITPKGNPIVEYANHLKESIIECFIIDQNIN